MKRVMVLALALFCASQNSQADVKGDWLGVLKLQGLELRIALRVTRSGAGTLSATLDSLDQGANNLPVEEIVQDGNTVRFTARRLGLSYSGTLEPGGNIIRGAMQQGGAAIPLNFERAASIPTLKRPQDPVRPYGYVEHEVRYRNEQDHTELAGTLTIPSGAGPHPSVVLITGSGAQDRDETIGGHRPFLVLSDYLTKRGIAVLRSDDRGMGKSSAGKPGDTSLTYAGDVQAAIGLLKQRPEIDPTRIGLAGHSEGGIIAAMAAARSRDVAFVVMLGGMGQTGEQVILAQTELMQRTQGVAPELIASTRTTLVEVFRALRSDPDAAIARARMREVLDGGVPAALRNTLLPQLQLYTTAWFRFFLDYDPAADLRNVRVPLLAITGELDLQAPARENLERIRAGAAAGGNRRVTVRELPGLNHLLQSAKTGLPDEYGTTEETISPAALELIAEWILENARGAEGPPA